jgi:integrase
MAQLVAISKSPRQLPTIEKRKVTPRRLPNKELRKHEYLTPGEVSRLLAAAAKLGRHGHRDETLLLLAYRHGLRVSELAALRWDQVDLKAGLLHVSRLKNGIPSVHPLHGPELRALRRLQREYEGKATPRGSTTQPRVLRIIDSASRARRAGRGRALRPSPSDIEDVPLLGASHASSWCSLQSA